MNKKILLVTLLTLLSTNIILAETPMNKYLSKLKILETKDGRQVETFEDVYIKLDPFQKRNKRYPIVNESEIPEGNVSEDIAEEYFEKFSSHAVLTDEEISFEDFINEHFSLSGIIKEFPQEYYFTKPGTEKYTLQMDDNYKYVSKFKKFSSNKNNIYPNFKENLLTNSKIKDAEEINDENNCIKLTFKNRTPPEITFDGKGDKAEEYNGFPVLGGDPSEGGGLSTYACTSSDWYKTPKGIIIGKSIPPIYFARFSFGRFGGCPDDGLDWKDYEQWTNIENIKKIDYSIQVKNAIPYFQDVVLFQNFDGFIRYSIFAKAGDNPDDKKSPVNPSIIVQQDRPDIGYGYPTAGDLGNTIETAQDWPEKGSLGAMNKKGYIDGLLRVYDNDLPNIIIRVTNEETGEQMFFPPCVASSECQISLSSKYKPISHSGKTNKDDYDLFVENLGPDYNYLALIDVPELNPYYTIYFIDGRSVKTNTEGSYIDKMLHNKDPKFINENVRVEDYFYSDTWEDGEKTFKSEGGKRYIGSFGKRRGTCSNMAALFENTTAFKFKTGVEYKLDVWTDDNVKWTNIEYPESFTGGPVMQRENVRNTGIRKSPNDAPVGGEQLQVGKPKLLETARVYHTGIKKGVIQLMVYGDNVEKDIDITKHINGGISFKLKDATPTNCQILGVEDLEAKGFPYIRVVAEDFAGLKRELKLFFRVSDKSF